MASVPPSSRSFRYPLLDLSEQVEAFWQKWPGARADASGGGFLAPDGAGVLQLPLAGPQAVALERIGDYFERLPEGVPGHGERQLVLLLRAGAMAFGCWQKGELLVHKAVRKYVVRGNGKAQVTHLKTRGKSKYGSRLRLQNWRSLLRETSERLQDCEEQFGAFDRIFYGVPIRVFSELLEVDPKLPFERGDARLQRLPLHVHRPGYEELLRVRGEMEYGRIELSE
jgi:hypothetical protein